MTVTLITGANKGLGRETARRLIEEGHTVYIGARSVERGQAAAAELGARFVQLDVTDDASVQAAMRVIEEDEGRLDVLVNNAGIGAGIGADGVTAETARAVFDQRRRRRPRHSGRPPVAA
jgi:NAD(P)-dependent dehydrogenase (short-subunit alcohol dehydrogenase family)